MRAFVLLGFGCAFGALAAPAGAPADRDVPAIAARLQVLPPEPTSRAHEARGSTRMMAAAKVRAKPAQEPSDAPVPKRPRPDPSALRDAQQAAASAKDLSSSAAYAHFLNARLAHASGDDRASLNELRLALASDPASRYLLAAVGEAHARLGEFERSRAELEKLVRRAPSDGRAHLLLGRVLHESGKSQAAAHHLSRAVALTPTDPEPYLALIQLHLDRDDVAGAERQANALAAAVPGETVAQRRLGEVLAESGDPKRAERLLRKSLAHDPSDAEAWLIVAGIAEADGRLDESEAALAHAGEHLEDPSEVLFSRGRIALRRGDHKAARAHFSRLFESGAGAELRIRVALQWLSRGVPKEAVVALRPTDPGLREARLSFFAGMLMVRLRDFEGAARAFAEAEGDPGLGGEAKRERASALSRAGRHQQALALLSRAAGAAPDDAGEHVALSLALERAGRAKEAEAVLRAPALADDDAAVVALASFLQRSARSPEALALLEAALAADPESSEVRQALGLLLARSGRGTDALELVRKQGDEWPDHAPTLNFAGYLMAEAGTRLDEAESLIRRALALRPNTGAYLDSLGLVLLRRGRVAAALEVLKEAAQLEPFEPVILDHLGEALRRSGRVGEAKRHWQRALELGVGPDVDVPPGFREAVRGKLEALSKRSGSR